MGMAGTSFESIKSQASPINGILASIQKYGLDTCGVLKRALLNLWKY
jgi:hypothetical protein